MGLLFRPRRQLLRLATGASAAPGTAAGGGDDPPRTGQDADDRRAGEADAATNPLEQQGEGSDLR
jgi:hypothetical protein